MQKLFFELNISPDFQVGRVIATLERALRAAFRFFSAPPRLSPFALNSPSRFCHPPSSILVLKPSPLIVPLPRAFFPSFQFCLSASSAPLRDASFGASRHCHRTADLRSAATPPHPAAPKTTLRPKSATTGKAGGLAEVERLKATEPAGESSEGQGEPARSGLSLPARNERGESRREGLFISPNRFRRFSIFLLCAVSAFALCVKFPVPLMPSSILIFPAPPRTPFVPRPLPNLRP